METRSYGNNKFEKEGINFEMKVYGDTQYFLPKVLLVIDNRFTINLEGASTGCGLYQLSGYSNLYGPLMKDEQLKTIGEVLKHLCYIAKSSSCVYSRMIGIFGGYIAASDAKSSSQLYVLNQLGFKPIHSFINYNEGLDHYQTLHFLEAAEYKKYESCQNQDIKYEVLFK